MGEKSRGLWSCRGIHSGLTAAPADIASWAGWPAALPVLLQLLGKLEAGGRPIVPYAITQLRHMTFQIKLVLFQPGDIQFLTGRAAFELSRDILFVIPDDSRACRSISPPKNHGKNVRTW